MPALRSAAGFIVGWCLGVWAYALLFVRGDGVGGIHVGALGFGLAGAFLGAWLGFAAKGGDPPSGPE